MDRRRPFHASKRRQVRAKLFKAQDGLCFYCKTPMLATYDKPGIPPDDYATFEHLKHHSEGGSWRGENIVLACWSCNRKRSNGPMPIVEATVCQ